MNLRQLGVFFILVALGGGASGTYHLFPSKEEKILERLTDEREARENERDAIDKVMWLRKQQEGVRVGPLETKPHDTSMREDWQNRKLSREKIMYVSFGVGGLLMIIGLICVASQNSPK